MLKDGQLVRVKASYEELEDFGILSYADAVLRSIGTIIDYDYDYDYGSYFIEFQECDEYGDALEFHLKKEWVFPLIENIE